MTPDSPHIIVAVDGSGVLESAGMEPVSFARGDAVVVPASVPRYSVRPQWDVEIMRMSLPAEAVPEPETTMAGAQRRLLRKDRGTSTIGQIRQAQFLSCHPRRRPRYAILADEPQAPRQATSAVEQQQEHDRGDLRSLAPLGHGEELLGYHQRRPSRAYSPRAAEAEQEAGRS